MSGTVQIRDATPDDEADWRRLWDGYLAFYEATIAPDITARTWAVDNFDNSRATGLELIDTFTLPLRSLLFRNEAAMQQVRAADELLHNIDAVQAHTMFRNLGGNANPSWRHPWVS